MTHQHHISRKELKKDQIRETLVHGAEAALSHQRMLWTAGGIGLLVVLAVAGWRFYGERQTVKATAAFDEASKIFYARIRLPNEPAQFGEVTYVDEKNKYDDAAKKFTEVAKSYSLTQPGRVARYYAGLSYAYLNNFDQAQKWLGEVERGGDAELAALARFQLAQLNQRHGKGDDAVKLYRALIEKPTTLVSKPLVMLALADYYRKTSRSEAEKLYIQIRAEFPDSEVARVAQERLESLNAKS